MKRLSSIKGLTAREVQERVNAGLVNTDAGLKTKTVGEIIAGNACTLFNLVNVLLALCVFLVHSYRNMLFLGVVISNLLIGIVQELRAKYVMDKLSVLTAAHAIVVREEEETVIFRNEVVKDDLMHLKSGMQICADSIVEYGECEVNESLLTGESVSVGKKPGDKLLSGSFLVSGDVYARVETVGADNYANKITSDARHMKEVRSEIQTSVMTIIKIVSVAIFPVALLLFWNQYTLQNANMQTAVVNTVAALLGMIPEGLVLLTSIVMAVSVVRLAKKQTLVQQMYSVETLARVDVFCLDKTGTLTKGEMQLTGRLSVSERDFEEPLSELMGAFKEGNPTFDAINKVYRREMWETKTMIPFSPDRKWSGVTFEEHGSYVLGAAEMILSSIDAGMDKMIDEHVSNGERVLLFAYSPEYITDKKLPGQIEPLALLFVEDIIKESAADTVAYLKNQGVQLKIISGDNPKAVSDIARRVGVDHAEQYVDCSAFSTEEELEAAAEENTVFGRVSPYQKKLLVQKLRKQHTVAMTGDGVNDVLALKEADCGIAMQAGSEAARNVADLVLMNSDFVSIPDIIAEGRRSINNLQRSSTLFLVKTVFAVILAVIFCFVNYKYPYQPIQMSLISGICIGIPSFVLALERNTERVTPGFLKKVFYIALPGGMMMASNVLVCVILAVIFHINQEQVSALSTYMGALVFAVILFKICYPFNLLRAVLCSCLAALFVIAVTVTGEIFYIVDLTLECYLLIGILEAGNLVVFGEFQKLIERLMNSKWFARMIDKE